MNLKNYDGQIILINERRPAIWNKKTLDIIKKSGCKILKSEFFLTKNEKNQIQSLGNSYSKKFYDLWENSKQFNELFLFFILISYVWYNITLIIDINAHKVFGGDLNDFFRLRKKFKYKYNYENIPLLNDIKLKSLRKCGYNGNNKNYDINLNNKINILYGYSQNFKILK